MKNTECYPERISKAGLGIVFLVLSLTFFILGFTALPVLGLVVAVPFLGAAIYFFRVHLDKNCEIAQ